MRLTALLFLLAVTMLVAAASTRARADDEPGIEVQGYCSGGRLVALRLYAPHAGMITIPLPADPCAGQEQRDAPKRPARMV